MPLLGVTTGTTTMMSTMQARSNEIDPHNTPFQIENHEPNKTLENVEAEGEIGLERKRSPTSKRREGDNEKTRLAVEIRISILEKELEEVTSSMRISESERLDNTDCHDDDHDNDEENNHNNTTSDPDTSNPPPTSQLTTSSARSARSTRTTSTLTTQLSHLRENDRRSLQHLPASQQRALLATQHKQMEKGGRAVNARRGALESAGNYFGRLGTVRLVRMPPHTGRVQSLKH